MKSTEIAEKYGVSIFELHNYIDNNATFSFKKNWWGDIYYLPDDIDIESFIQPFLKEKEEIANRKSAAKLEAEKQKQAEQQRKQEEQEKARQEKEALERKRREEQYHLRLDNLKSMKFDGYYEYKVISLSDVSGLFKKNSGKVDIDAMTRTLNDLGLDGWHLVTAYSNELGKNALSGGVGGALLGVNSTVDENILIFERFVKI